MKLADSLNPATQAENIKKLNAGLEAVYAKMPPDYSETETATGQKWIDGKDVYVRVLSGKFPEITSTQNITLTGFIGSDIINITCLLKTTERIYCNQFSVFYRLDNNAFVISSVSTTFSECEYTLIIYYTKPDPVPETREDKTKTRKKK